jgi:O-antigen/teichoic acid export membrane protein
MSADPNASISRQTASGSLYSVSASAVTIVLGFVRMTLMLRLLAPEQFGVAALALFYLNLVFQIFAWGFDSALVHRKEADERVRSVYFVLKIGSAVLTAAVSLLIIPLLHFLYPGEPLLVPVLLAYAGINIVRSLNISQVTVLSKEMDFRRLSITDVLSSILMTIFAPLLAWLGFGVWSIVAEQFFGVMTRFLLLWIPFRAWLPRPGWDREIARWFWNFGKHVWSSTNLVFLIDHFDDWFVGTFLGSTALGFYSQAYEYARYPRRVVANPILLVFFPAFARLQDDRQRLSKAFFRATSLMLRAGGLFSLVVIFAAPEFILLLLGEKWLPMLLTFQLMIVYTLLDPINLGVNNLLLATGRSVEVMRTRLWQAIVFLPGVALLGLWLGIEGVALAADIMMLLGTLLFFRYARQVVDYSGRTMWLWPIVAMILTGAVVVLATPLWEALPLAASLAIKVILIPMLYLAILWLTEREQLRTGREMIWQIIWPLLADRLPAGSGRRAA